FANVCILLYWLITPLYFTYTCFCDIYTNITESWRNWEYYGHISPGYPNDDAKLVGSWWRFTGIGGDIVVTECVIAGRGGTRSTISIPSSEYPPGELADPITATAYGHIDTSCTDVFMQVDIFRCPGGFYIYRPLNHKAPEMGKEDILNNEKPKRIFARQMPTFKTRHQR
uniref:Uncharacterized protein n=1 Tax=Gouania willdenowi TaxID=441366 RepID=A0A8C5EMH3_GOUWI